jgi:multiple antibiotic resistance protein
MNIYSAIITLILVMDPLGNVPVFLSILNKIEPKKRQYIILRETFIAFLILLTFLFFGKYILQSMNVSGPALSVSGGIILFLIAIKMIFPSEEPDGPRVNVIGEPFIVPLAIPLVAGPSALAFVMLLANQDPGHIWIWALALLVASLTTTIILMFANTLRKILGDRGLTAIERLMGMILTTMAVQMFLTGLEEFFHLH